MITETEAVALMNEANPVPDLDSYDVTNPGVAAYLSDLEQGSSNVTQLDTKPTEQAKPKRGRLVLVLGAAAAIILTGALVVLNQPEEVVPPAIQPTVTTVGAVVTTSIVDDTVDPIAEEGLSVATAFIEALLVGDLETAQSHALDSVALFLVDGGGSPGVGPSGELPWKNALGWEATLEGCVVTTATPDSTRVTCSVTNSTDISRALGVD
ncbi:MAG: hypothetical protein WBM90_12105, partial [Acidimicrobiia bacterium]